jgi:hypothetical protein
MTTYVQPTLANCISATCTFDLWMSKGARDVIAIVVNFILSDWEARHVTVELFKVLDISGVVMAPKL